MKKRTFLTCACLVATLTVCMFSVIQANAGSVEDQREIWSNKWLAVDRPGGPADVFKTRRAAKISEYATAINSASIKRADAISEAARIFADKITNSSNEEELREARVDFDEARSKADSDWTNAEDNAYKALLKGIRNDYRTALNTRADEFRKTRVTVWRKFHIKARSKDYPSAGRESDGVKGTITYPKIQEGKDSMGNLQWRREWEVADINDINPRRQNTDGSLSRNDMWWIDDGKVVGLGFNFSLWGPDYYAWTGREYYRRNGDLKCTFKLTEKACVEQARRGLWNITDDDLVTCDKLLNQVGFKRAVLPK